MTLKWDDYLTVLDEDDLDEAEEERITQRLEYALK
jgi:RNA polymerase subunit RPABC4/transcription elongation factor Spt4